MPSRNQNILSLTRTSAFLLLVVLVLVNVAGARTNVRLDLTEEGLYTLTPASESLLSSLADPAIVKVFWHNVPERGEPIRRFVRSLLEEMKAAAGSRLTVRWIDLEDEAGTQEAEDAGVQVMQFRQSTEGEVRATAGYSSLVIQVGDESEIIQALLDVGTGLEYEVVSRLNKMTRVEEVVIGLVAPRPAMNPFQGAQGGRFRSLEGLLRDQFGRGFRSQLPLDQPVPPDVRVLVVVGPQDLEPAAVYHLEQFLLGGGRVFLLLDPVHAPVLQAPSSRPESSGLEEWLAHHGVTVKNGIVGDVLNFQRRPRDMRAGRARMQELILYPYWPGLVRDHIDQTNPATRDFDFIPLFWPVALSLDGEKHKAAGRRATILATTSEGGWQRDDLIGLDTAEQDFAGRSQDQLLADPGCTPNIPLMVLLEGPFESFWKGRPAPGEEEEPAEGSEDEGAEGDPDGEDAPEEPAEPAEPTAEDGPERLESGEGLMLVMTDAEFLSDDAVQLRTLIGLTGFQFANNVIDWMSGSESLLQIRARKQGSRQIERTEPKEQKLVNWVNILAIPLLVFFAGVVVFIVRRYQR